MEVLHLTDNNNEVQIGFDKVFKVRKLLDLLCLLFESDFNMHQSCTIDEAMIPFKGRLKFKQYMKDKPTKWGIKFFVLADSQTGYVERIQVYTARERFRQLFSDVHCKFSGVETRQITSKLRCDYTPLRRSVRFTPTGECEHQCAFLMIFMARYNPRIY